MLQSVSVQDLRKIKNKKSRQKHSILEKTGRLTHRSEKYQIIRQTLTQQDLRSFSSPQWKDLTKINLWDNKISSFGCKYISRASLNSLTQLRLGKNEIGSEGVHHLSKASFHKLQTLYFRNNKIGVDGTKWLALADWKSLKIIYLAFNIITEAEARHLLRSQWNIISEISLSKNMVEYYQEEKIQKLLENKFEGTDITL